MSSELATRHEAMHLMELLAADGDAAARIGRSSWRRVGTSCHVSSRRDREREPVLDPGDESDLLLGLCLHLFDQPLGDLFAAPIIVRLFSRGRR